MKARGQSPVASRQPPVVAPHTTGGRTASYRLGVAAAVSAAESTAELAPPEAMSAHMEGGAPRRLGAAGVQSGGWRMADGGCDFPITKNQERRTKNAFTIIEILGVLLLLSILIAMLVSVVGLVQRKAQQCRAQADATALVQAVLHYQQVYGAWPGAATNGASDLCIAGNQSLASSLFGGSSTLGITTTNTDLAAVIAALAPNNPAANPRQLLFLTVPTNALVNGLSDPWGNSYLLVMGAQQCIFQYGDFAFSNLPAFAISAGAPVANPTVSNRIFSAGVRP